MTLPSSLTSKTEWVLIGPLGPTLLPPLLGHPSIAVDGGARFAPESDVWVGDADSFHAKIKASHIFRYPPEKDHSDLALALSLLNPVISQRLHLWGFLGGRRDHELFNLGEVHRFLRPAKRCEILIYDYSGKVSFWFMGPGHWRFTHQGPFSLGALRATSVTLTGYCRYQLKTATKLDSLSSFGLSNEASGEITLEADNPVFLYFPGVS